MNIKLSFAFSEISIYIVELWHLNRWGDGGRYFFLKSSFCLSGQNKVMWVLRERVLLEH